jgi:hypothetical protein
MLQREKSRKKQTWIFEGDQLLYRSCTVILHGQSPSESINHVQTRTYALAKHKRTIAHTHPQPHTQAFPPLSHTHTRKRTNSRTHSPTHAHTTHTGTHTLTLTYSYVRSQFGAIQNLLGPSSRRKKAHSERSIQVHSQGCRHAQER